MAKLNLGMMWRASLACAVVLAACGGGSDGGATPPSARSGSLQPIVSIETDPDGARYIRVLEQIFDPFAATPAQRTFSGMTGSPDRIEGRESALVSNVHVRGEKYGVHVVGRGPVSILDYSYVHFDGGGSIHGAAIKIERRSSAPTYIQSVFADGEQAPDPTYDVSNTDFLGIEDRSGPVYVRGATARNFGDAGVDTKSTAIYLMNVTFESANRMLRAWPNTEIIVVNSIINTAPGDSAHAWVHDSSATIRYYNVLWCSAADAPSPEHADCGPSPRVVEGDDISEEQARRRVIALDANPLPSVHPFFNSEIDRIVVEYSSDGGATWRPMSLPNAGGGGRAPVGDTRYRIPLDLDAGEYLFRAHFELNDAQVGEISQVIGEDGTPTR